MVCMRGRAGYIHEYAKDLGMNDDEAVYPSFYLRHIFIDLSSKFCSFLDLAQVGREREREKELRENSA